MSQYRKKPIVVEALQYTGKNHNEMLHFMCPDLPDDAVAFDETIKTLEGKLHVSPMDWVIRGVKGELYPCKPDIFEETYELLEEAEKMDKKRWIAFYGGR